MERSFDIKMSRTAIQTKCLDEFNADPQTSIEPVRDAEARIIVRNDGIALTVLISKNFTNLNSSEIETLPCSMRSDRRGETFPVKKLSEKQKNRSDSRRWGGKRGIPS